MNAVKFGAEEDALFQTLNPDVCEYVRQDTPFTIEETTETGKAVIKLTSSCPCFVVRCLDEKARIRSLPFFNQTWPQVTQCADHLAFLFDPDTRTWTLHVFELKRAPDKSKWEKIKRQFNGAMVRAYAIAGALRIPEFRRVFLHCGYRKDTSSPVKVKPLPGKPTPSAPESFMNGPIQLYSYPKLIPENAPIHLDEETGFACVQLDANGYAVL